MKGGTVQINWHDTQPVLTLDFHPVSGLLATGGIDRDIKLWIVSPTESQKKFPAVTYKSSLSYHGSAVNILRFSPSGEFLASGADGGELVIWKLQSADEPHVWKVFKTLLFHRKDVLDLEWSADGVFLVSGSVDNSCILWDVNKGSVHQILDGHLHYVQGVAWDPLGHYVASLSSDRSCRIYAKKTQKKTRGPEKVNYVCQHVLSKPEPHKQDEAKPLSTRSHLFHDETLPSFFRRLAWSPDGSFLLVPAGICKYSSASETVNTAYIFSRKDFSRPAIQLPGASKPIVAVRFCRVLFHLRGTNSDSSFKLPYRVVFAVATLNSLYIYDTECPVPIAVYAGLHYAAITDICWSSNGTYLALSSRDGYCTIVEFENDELGRPFSTDKSMHKESMGNASPLTMNPNVMDAMDIDNAKETKVEPDKSPNLTERKKELSASGKNSETSGTSKKRITPMAISHPTTKEPSITINMDTNEGSKGKEGKEEKAAPAKSSDSSKTSKKRITPVAIN